MLSVPRAVVRRRAVSPLQKPGLGVVLIAAALAAGQARADVEWHPDLDTAHAAARISQRPVLALFVADMDVDTAAFEAACLGSPEAEAVLATCFEPVRVRIHERPDLARAAGVTHVPSACVMSVEEAPVARLDAPNSPAAFVTAAIIAAQRVAAEQDASPVIADAGRAAPDLASTEAAGVVGTTARGSLARVTAKVRNLSAFARSQPQAPAGEQGAAVPTPAPPARDTASTISPAAAPVAWPAETSGPPPTDVAARPTIEPAAGNLVAPANTPWLDAPAQQAPPPSSPPSTPHPSLAAAPAATPAATALPEPAAPPAPKLPWHKQFIAAIQKPFGGGSKAAEPPTMPPALSRGSLAAAADPVSPPAPGSDPVPDPYGSMPLGLEGYCPVTLVDRGAWSEGRAQWGARHRGRTYLFAGPDEQRTFLADPDRYAPALSGDDPVLALDRSSSTPGQRRYGVTYQSRMYLFASPETRQAFTADPDRYAARIALAERLPAAAGDTRRY